MASCALETRQTLNDKLSAKTRTMYHRFFFVWKVHMVLYVVVFLHWSTAHQLKISISLKTYGVYVFLEKFQLC